MKRRAQNWHCTTKWSFALGISSVNLTKSSEKCGFGHIYWRNSSWKTSFFVQRDKDFEHDLNNWIQFKISDVKLSIRKNKNMYVATFNIFQWIILRILFQFSQHNFMYDKNNKFSQPARVTSGYWALSIVMLMKNAPFFFKHPFLIDVLENID